MSSQDDPEERIRELERSLGDRTSELTQSSAETSPVQYGAWPPPPPPGPPPPQYPPTYGAPFPTVPMSSGGGGRGWIVIGVMTVITVGIITGAFFFVSGVFSDVSSLIGRSSSTPTVAEGGGTFGEPPGPSGANRPQITIAAPTVSRAPAGSDISVSGVRENRTIECNDGNVNVSGVENAVTLTGHCATVTVSGVDNVVVVDEADTIIASGLGNRVTYGTGSPDVQKSGGSNVVERR